MIWMKAKQAAKYAGGISTKTLYAMHAAGKVRAVPVGCGRNFLFADEWLDADLAALARTDVGSRPDDGARPSRGAASDREATR